MNLSKITEVILVLLSLCSICLAGAMIYFAATGQVSDKVLDDKQMPTVLIMPTWTHHVVHDGNECWVVRENEKSGTWEAIYKSSDILDCNNYLRRIHDEN